MATPSMSHSPPGERSHDNTCNKAIREPDEVLLLTQRWVGWTKAGELEKKHWNLLMICLDFICWTTKQQKPQQFKLKLSFQFKVPQTPIPTTSLQCKIWSQGEKNQNYNRLLHIRNINQWSFGYLFKWHLVVILHSGVILPLSSAYLMNLFLVQLSLSPHTEIRRFLVRYSNNSKITLGHSAGDPK